MNGVCCESACTGECSACSSALTAQPDGTCAPISADEDPENECAADPGYPASCGEDGSCDGAGACRAYAKAGTACGASATTCSDGVVSGDLCSGTGQCNADNTATCAPYLCDGDACGTSCSSDADCASGFGCSSEECVPKSPQCFDETTSKNSADKLTSCAPYYCDVTNGSCPDSCGSSSDCVSGFVFDPSVKTCEPIKTDSTQDAGFGCRAAGGSRKAGWPWAILATLGALLLRRHCSFQMRSAG